MQDVTHSDEAKPLGSHFWLVLGVLAIVVAIYVLHVPMPYLVYSFKGTVIANDLSNAEYLCIYPDSDERSFLTDWWFATDDAVCGTVAIGGFFRPNLTAGTRVSASITWLRIPNGNKVKTYLFIQQ